MRDIPMIFSAPMIRALIEGRKTMTRRILSPQPMADGYFQGPLHFEELSLPVYTDGRPVARWSADAVGGGAVREDGVVIKYCPKDRIYVREAFTYIEPRRKEPPWGGVVFRADMRDTNGDSWANVDGADTVKFRPSIHMPRWASRLTLHVTDVKVEQLQEITNEDAVEEGCKGFYTPQHPDLGESDGQEPWEEFRDLWNSLHGAEAWNANPWVAAISFEVEKCNIDKARA